MKRKIKRLFRKAYNKLLRRNNHGAIREQKPNGYIKLSYGCLTGKLIKQ